MKNLDDFCKKLITDKWKYVLPNEDGYRTFDEFCDINNFTDETITEDAIDFYYKYNINYAFGRHDINYSGIFNETLTSHDVTKLINKLQTEFKDDIKYIRRMSGNFDSKAVPIEIKLKWKNNIINSTCDYENNKLLDTDTAKEFLKTLDFYGYYITVIDINMAMFYVYVEPKFTKNVFDDVRKDGGYIYHVTNLSLTDKIKKQGLRPKVGKTIKNGGYRYFPERIYFIRHNKNKAKLIENIKSIIKDKNLDKYVILKISLKNHNIGLYINTAYDDSNNIYTVECIQSSLIETITDINKL